MTPAGVAQLVSAKPDPNPALPLASCTSHQACISQVSIEKYFPAEYSWVLRLTGQSEVGFLTAGFSEPFVYIVSLWDGHEVAACPASVGRETLLPDAISHSVLESSYCAMLFSVDSCHLEKESPNFWKLFLVLRCHSRRD